MKWGNYGRLREEIGRKMYNYNRNELRALAMRSGTVLLRHIHSQPTNQIRVDACVVVTLRTLCNFATIHIYSMKATTTKWGKKKYCTRQCLPISVNVYVVIGMLSARRCEKFNFFANPEEECTIFSTKSFNSSARVANLVNGSKIIAAVVGDDGF